MKRMKRSQKILALVLALATLVSLFAAGNAFAKGTTKQTGEPAERYERYHKEVYDGQTFFDPAFWDIYTFDGWEFTRADRNYTDEIFKIVDHVVYMRSDPISPKGEDLYYIVVDYFDTAECQNTATTIKIKAAIDGIPVRQLSVFYRQPGNHELGNQGAFLKNVTSVSLPDSIAVISNSSLSYFPNLKKIKLPENLRSIGIGAFSGSGLEAVKIPRGVVRIGERAFQNCDQLKRVVFAGNKVKNIDDLAFANCDALTAFTSPAGANLSATALLECKNLKVLKLQGKVGNYNGAMLSGSSATILVTDPKLKAFFQQELTDNGIQDFKGKILVKVSVAAPKKLAAKQKGSRVFLKWTPVAKATGYRVYRYNAADKTYSAVKTVKGANSVLLKPAKSGTYRYAVKAFRTLSGDTSWSAYTNLVKVAYTK